MITFKQYINEGFGTALAALGIAGAAMAAPPKPEAVDRMVQYVKQKEGFRAVAEPDKDATGHPIVVGYGTTHTHPDTGKPIKVGEKITPEKAEEHIRTFFNNMTPHMEKIPDWDKMDAGKQSALLSFGYNFGPAFYGNKNFSKITADLKNKNWENVPNTLKLYNKGGGKVLGGLVTRREMEGKMWKEGSASTPPAPTQAPAPTSTHEVVKGDTLGAIAKKYGKSVQDIQKLNPDIKDVNAIKPGQKIKTK